MHWVVEHWKLILASSCYLRCNLHGFRKSSFLLYFLHWIKKRPTNDSIQWTKTTAEPSYQTLRLRLMRPSVHYLIAHIFCCCSVYEKKCVSRGEALAPATQSKLSRVSSGFGLSKLTGVRRHKKENSLNKNSLSAQVNSYRQCSNYKVCVCVGEPHVSIVFFFTNRRHSNGCSLTLRSSETWWLCSTRSIKRYHTGIVSRHKQSVQERN